MIELATFIGSYVLSFMSTSVSNSMKMRAQHQKYLLKLAGLKEESTLAARKVTDGFTKFTRRILALMTVGTLIVGVVALSAYNVPVAVETTRITGGWLIFPERETTEFITVNAIPFLKEYKMILLSIFGLYFGNNHAR